MSVSGTAVSFPKMRFECRYHEKFGSDFYDLCLIRNVINFMQGLALYIFKEAFVRSNRRLMANDARVICVKKRYSPLFGGHKLTKMWWIKHIKDSAFYNFFWGNTLIRVDQNLFQVGWVQNLFLGKWQQIRKCTFVFE